MEIEKLKAGLANQIMASLASPLGKRLGRGGNDLSKLGCSGYAVPAGGLLCNWGFRLLVLVWAVVPPAARSCLYLERDGSSWLGPGVGWLAVALKDS